jgi:frizzled protein 5/8
MLQTFAILLSSAVEGDSVGGICYVGTRSPQSMVGYVLVPLFIYLLLGITFLAAGFISLFRIRTVIKEQGGRAKIDKLEKLMVKIGIFSVLYIVPAGTVIACSAYELVSLPHWERSYLCPDCVPRNQLSYPDFSVLMLKYFMSLAVGITSGFWVWSGKTIDAWWNCLSRLCGISRHLKVPPQAGGGGGGGVGRAADPLPALPLPQAGTGTCGTRSVTPATHTGNLYSTIPHKQTSGPLNHV